MMTLLTILAIDPTFIFDFNMHLVPTTSGPTPSNYFHSSKESTSFHNKSLDC
jgi:hypothetical protein